MKKIWDRFAEVSRLLGRRTTPDTTTARLQSQAHESTERLYMDTPPNLAHGLTPRRLKNILDMADAGDILEQHLLFADMEDRCEHLSAEMGKRKRALLTLDWSIVPASSPKQSSHAADIAAAVQEQITGLQGFEDLLMDMADAIGHGFAACELEWDYTPFGQHLPAAFHFRPQSWFQVRRTNKNQLRLRNGTPDGEALWSLGWLVHTHRSRSGWLPRYGLFRSLAWAYLVRSFALEANIRYVQVHGLPFRLGKYPAGSREEDKRALYNALRSLGQDAAGIIPQGMEILFETPAASSNDLAGALITRCELGMSKAILGGTLTTQADGKSSTNALGQIHDRIRRDLMVSDAAQLAATLTRQLVAPLAVLNCGVTDLRLLPSFRFDTREAEDIAIYAKALPALAPVMKISSRWAHEKLKIPVAQDEQDILGHWTVPPQA